MTRRHSTWALATLTLAFVGWIVYGDSLAGQQRGAGPANPPAAARGRGAAADSGLTADQFDRLVKQVSNWGRWGKDDELGTLNLITPAKRMQAASLVKAGITVSLSRTITKESVGARAAFQRGFVSVIALGGKEYGERLSWVEEQHQIGYHVGPVTHFDALCHVAWDDMLYNGRSFKETVTASDGCAKNAVGVLKNGIATRGVLVDVESQGRVRREDVEAWEKKTGIKISSGDALFLRKAHNRGFDINSIVPFIKERDVAMLLSDGGVEGGGVPDRAGIPMHVLTLVALGMPLIDGIDLTEAAATAARLNRSEFMFVVAPIPVRTGTGAAVNPLALF